MTTSTKKTRPGTTVADPLDSGSYATTMDGLRFSPEAKARMTTRLEEALKQRSAANGPEKPTSSDASPAKLLALPTARARRRRGILRYAAAAALVAALGLGGTVAYATGALRPVAQVFASVFGPGPAQTEVIDKIGRPVGATASSNGVSITADAIIGDRTNYVVVFSITRDDGQPFDLTDVTGDSIWARPGNTDEGLAKKTLGLGFADGSGTLEIDGVAASGGGSYFYDDDPSDDSIQFVLNVSAFGNEDVESVIGKTARIHFGDIVSYEWPAREGDEITTKTFAKGSWDLAFALDYEDSSIELPSGQTFDREGMSVTVNSLTVSAIGISTSYTVNGLPNFEEQGSGQLSEHNAAEQDKFMSVPLLVTFADGHVEDGTESAASMQQDEAAGTTEVKKSYSFETISNTDDIVSVTIGDVTVPVNAS